MTKPWEETWRWDEEHMCIATGVRNDDDGEQETWRRIVETDGGCYPPHGAEIPLIVQAPAMARCLLYIISEEANASMGSKERKDIENVLRAAGVIE